MPRADIARLGIRHRRVPILSIGRDVYLDSRLQLQKLEAAFPSYPRLGKASTPEHRALERLLSAMMIDGGVFANASLLIPTDLPLMRDPKFTKDRDDFFNHRVVDPHARADAINEIRLAAELLETSILADGRQWVLGSDGPTLADIEAVWPFHWLTTMSGALPADEVSADQFPRLFAWVERFKAAVSAARRAGPPVPGVDGARALEIIVESAFHEAESEVDGADGLVRYCNLAKGQRVTLWPVDTGSSGKDEGRLVSIDSKEVVIETETEAGGVTVRVHAPRHGFRVWPASGRPNL